MPPRTLQTNAVERALVERALHQIASNASNTRTITAMRARSEVLNLLRDRVPFSCSPVGGDSWEVTTVGRAATDTTDAKDDAEPGD